jgi:hypothetical protein
MGYSASLLFLVSLTGSARAAAPDPRAPRQAAITISIDDVKVAEDEGDVEAFFTVTLSGPSATPVSVHYETHDGTATAADDDYLPASGTLTIPSNMLTGTITVVVPGDPAFEGDETYTVDLSNPVGAAIADGQGVGTISNNDPMPQLSVGNVTVAEGDSGTTAAVFTAVLARLSGMPASFQYQTVDGTATAADGDYATASGTVTIPAKTLSVTFTVFVNGDRILEPTESFQLQLSNPSGATLTNTTATATITNDDASPQIRIDDVTVIEGNSGTTPGVFTVSLSNPTYQTVNFSYATFDISASHFGGDYQQVPLTVVTIPPKASSTTVTIQVMGDVEVEDDEVFAVVLSRPFHATIQYDTGRGTIANDDLPPVLSIGDASLYEGNSGATAVVLTVRRTGTTSQTVTAAWHTADGSALASDGDYQPASGTVAIPPQSSTGTITVLVNGDTRIEPHESFSVILSDPINAAIADGEAVVTVINDDQPIVPTFLTINDVNVSEGNDVAHPVMLTVSRGGDTQPSVDANWHTEDGSALAADGDYQPASGTVHIPSGATTGTITVFVNGDTRVEPNEFFSVILTEAINASINDPRGDVFISNDDVAPWVSITDVKVIEGDSSVVAAMLTVTRFNIATQTLTVDWQTSDGSATVAGGDYQPASGTLAIPPESSSATITVLVNGDRHPEPDEFFSVILSNSTNATIADGRGDVTISNDDPIPSVGITGGSVVEGDSGTGNLVFKVSIDPQNEKFQVPYHTADGTATAASGDYVSQSGTLSFAPGETSKTLTVLVNGDIPYEQDETMLMVLDAIGGTVSAVGTIVNDDPPVVVTFADAAAITEGASGSRTARFPVTVSSPSGDPIQVTYQTVDGTATVANNDYQAKSATLVIPAGAPSDTIRITVIGDTRFEADETFFVNITSVVGAVNGGPATVQGTILNDDGPPQIQVTSGNTGAQAKNEGNSGKAAFPIQLLLVGADGLSTVECDWHTADGSATVANNDYQPASGHATFAPSTTTATITVFVNGDLTHEAWETIAIVLENPVNATLRDFGFGPGVGHVSIADDDPEPLISIGDPVVREGNDGETPCAFSISLSRPNAVAAVSVHWTTIDDLALGGNSPDGDFTLGSGLVTFAPGQTQAVVTIDVHGDTENEPDETFQILLTQPLHGTIQDNTGVGTIVNDDGVVGVPPGEPITSFALGRVTPNPSRYGQPVTIEYTLPRTASFRVSMVDVQGREVAVLASGMTPRGRYRATWNGDQMPAGLYFVRYRFPGGKARVQRLVLTR